MEFHDQHRCAPARWAGPRAEHARRPAAKYLLLMNAESLLISIARVKSIESLRGRATTVAFGEHELRIASLADIIRSKARAGREQDLAVLPVLRRTLREKEAE